MVGLYFYRCVEDIASHPSLIDRVEQVYWTWNRKPTAEEIAVNLEERWQGYHMADYRASLYKFSRDLLATRRVVHLTRRDLQPDIHNRAAWVFHPESVIWNNQRQPRYIQTVRTLYGVQVVVGRP